MFEGEAVRNMYSCDQCGSGYLSPMPDVVDDDPEKPLPRSGSGTTFLTRDDY